MDLHYNAFISYRHHPQDIKVAETIHRSLERFKVPKAIKQQGKTIERIFRDKEELPITSSLTDTITMALRNSDYQIVICSTHLKGSYWVQREIETFLQTHTKDKVLTVLVDGDNPYDVIPEILTYNEVVDPVTGEVTREPIEPLSCDWRMSKRKAMKTELPRLAAVLLGCTYDDLIQRQKQYRQRRLMAGVSTGMAASLALAGYFLYTSIQIQENLNQSLRNQSQFLASTAISRFEEGDRLTALALAMEALPTDNDRPYVPDAELALNQALMQYDAEGQLISVAAFNAESTIRSFVVSDDGKIIYIMDSQYTVTAWDTIEYKKLSTFNVGGSNSNMLTDNDSNLLIIGGSSQDPLLVCYNYSGELLWQMSNCKDIAFCAKKEVLLAIDVEKDQNLQIPDKFRLLQIDPKTGALLIDPYVAFDYNAMHSPLFTADTYYEGQPVSIRGYLSNGNSRIMITAPETQSSRAVLDYKALFYGSSVTEDGLAYIMVTENEDMTSGRMNDYYFYTQNRAFLHCFDMSTGKQLWRTTITSYNYSEANTIAPIPNSDRLFCQYGSAFLQLDAKTGKILEECHATTIPLTIQMRDTTAWVLFNNGCAGSYTFATNQLGYIQYMENGLLLGHNNNGIYVVPQLSSSVLLYRNTNDADYEAFHGEYDDYIDQMSLCDAYLATYGSGCLNLFDLSDHKLLWRQEIGYGFNVLGFASDSSKIYLHNSKHITEINTETGTRSEWDLPYVADGYSHYFDTIRQQDNMLFDLIYSYTEGLPYLAVCDCETGEYVMYPFLTAEEQSNWEDVYRETGSTPTILHIDETCILIRCPSSNLYRFDRGTNESVIIRTDVRANPIFLLDAQAERMAFGTAEGISLTDLTGTSVLELPLDDLSAASFCIHDDQLLFLGSDSKVYRYDMEGNLLSSTPLFVYNTFFNKLNYISTEKIPISWAFTPDGDLILNALRMGNIINTEYWERTANVPQLVFYHEASDSFICQANDMIYAYERSDLEETKAKATKELHSFTLSEAQRTAYGLN